MFLIALTSAQSKPSKVAGDTIEYPGERSPGAARLSIEGDTRILENDLLSFRFTVAGGVVTDAACETRRGTPGKVAVNEPFSLIVDGEPVALLQHLVDGKLRNEK